MATYEEVKDAPNHPELYLIDVRDEHELEETGSIPASLNIPLPDVLGALSTSPEDFSEAYGREKPEKDSNIIFTCRSGRRASEAMHIATHAGYTKVRVYNGSWDEWVVKEGLDKCPSTCDT